MTLSTQENSPRLYDLASFRDPDGKVVMEGDRVFRELTSSGKRAWEDLKAASFFESFVHKGFLVKTWELNSSQDQKETKTVLEHEKIPFISYAYEWPPSLLKEAALFHLSLCEELVLKGYILKDATPFNIQFKGCRPCLIDVLSIEKLVEGDVWAGYGQFCDTFLYPLMLYAYKGIAYHPWLKGSPQGISPEEVAPLFGVNDIFRRGVFFHVKMRNLFHKNFRDPEEIKRSEIRGAKLSPHLILNNIKSLARVIRHFNLRERRESLWTKYVENNTYDDNSLSKKMSFVENFVKGIQPKLTWDLGCNVGVFSEMAAKFSSYVVSFDSDIGAVEKFAHRCQKRGVQNILPLVMDMANPSPNLGWMCEERRSILNRGKPEVLLALALMHHLFIRESIPLENQLFFFARSARYSVVEYVDVQDPMYTKLMTNITKKSEGYNRAEFDYWIKKYFKVLASQSLKDTRTLYALESTLP